MSGRVGHQGRATGARRRLDLLASGGLAIVAVATGVVALAARSGGGAAAHVSSAPKRSAPERVLAVSAAGVAPGVTGSARAAAAVSRARAESEALVRSGVQMQSAGAVDRTAGLLKALPPRRISVVHARVRSTGVVAATYHAPAQTTPTYTAPAETTPTYTVPAETTPTYTPAPAPPTAPSSTGGGSTGGGSASSGSSGSGSVSGGG